jgi:hypothetical protein
MKVSANWCMNNCDFMGDVENARVKPNLKHLLFRDKSTSHSHPGSSQMLPDSKEHCDLIFWAQIGLQKQGHLCQFPRTFAAWWMLKALAYGLPSEESLLFSVHSLKPPRSCHYRLPWVHTPLHLAW